MTKFAVRQKQHKIRQKKKLPGVEYCLKYSVSTEASSEARQGCRLERRWCRGQCCRQGDFFINSAVPFPVSAAQLLYYIQCYFWWYFGCFFFLGDLSINENQGLQGCFYFTVNTIPLLPSRHSGNVKRSRSRNLLHIFSVWVPSNCNSNKCRSQDPPSKLHQFPYSTLLPIGKSVLFLKSIFTISYIIYRV